MPEIELLDGNTRTEELKESRNELFRRKLGKFETFLVIIAVVLVVLLLATIPLAFVLTYMKPEARTAEVSSTEYKTNIIDSLQRQHRNWPNESQLDTYRDWDEHKILQSSSLLPPNISICTTFGFACTDKPYIVIPKNRRCDGYKDCEDGSDELDCHECQATFSCSTNNNSKKKICLVGEHLCDGFKHCPNGEDETLYCRAECKTGEYKCPNLDICLPNDAVCDGEEHCPFGEDEKNCENVECKNGAKKCAGKVCLPKRKLCDGSMDCLEDGGSDEKDCDCSSCSGKNSALCNSKEKFCLNKKQICDGNKDCPGGEDEKDCPGVCPALGNSSSELQNGNDTKIINRGLIRCADGQFYEWDTACNGLKPQCQFSCETCNQEMAFQCESHPIENITTIFDELSNDTATERQQNFTDVEQKYVDSQGQHRFKGCIHRSLVCDGKKDCADGSDEAKCSCTEGTHECQQQGKMSHLPFVLIRRCYLDSQKCDGYSDCVGGDDERDCEACKNGAFFCSSERMCIPSAKRCNGRDDCEDKSDEEGCTCEQCARQSEQMYMCNGAQRCYPLNEVCNPYTSCPNATNLDKLFCAIRGNDYL